MNLTETLYSFIEQNKLLVSIIITVLFLVIRHGVLTLLRNRAKRKKQDMRSTLNTLRNLSNFVLFGLILYIWSSEIQSFAISIAAFTVAIVFATREYIQCLIGFVYISGTRAFGVGDWIQVEHVYGEVTHKDWLKVTLLEIDHECYGYTGKTLTIPNNKLVNNAIKNMNYLKRYASHTFKITVEPVADVFEFVDPLLEKANSYCEHFNDVALRYSSLIEHRLDVTIQGPDADIRIVTNELGKTQLEVTIFSPTEQAIEIEQKITRDFMQMWYQRLQHGRRHPMVSSHDDNKNANEENYQLLKQA